MLNLKTLRGAKGAKKTVKRLGRGVGSGKGNTSGKGHKGLLARKGGGRRPGYEGGQTPLFRRIPKRGFHNFFREEFFIINLAQLETAGIADISLESLREAGIAKGTESKLKILATGDLTKALKVKAHKVSAAALEKIQKAGGKVEVVDVRG